jgi:hypothetical protein
MFEIIILMLIIMSIRSCILQAIQIERLCELILATVILSLIFYITCVYAIYYEMTTDIVTYFISTNASIRDLHVGDLRIV